MKRHASESRHIEHIIVMGVAGAGKSAVGARLAEALGYVFADADAFHSAANVAKLMSGIALTDADRAPWLAALARWLADEHEAGRSTVLACSALKRRYRDRLRTAAPNVHFVHLSADDTTLRARMTSRAHFMPQSLLDSQLRDLEPLAPDERGIESSADRPLDELVADLVEHLAQRTARD